MKRPTPAAFTLIEMLVVISLVTLLIALISPAFRHAREAARRAICGGNARQLSIAFGSYTIDANAYPGVGGGGFAPATSPWVDCSAGHYFNGAPAKPKSGVLYPYVGDAGVYRCPSTDGRGAHWPSYAPQTISYKLPWVWDHRKREDAFISSDVILLVEAGNSRSLWGRQPDDALYQPYSGDLLKYDSPADRHGEQCTLALIDGQVIWRRWDAMSSLSFDYFLVP